MKRITPLAILVLLLFNYSCHNNRNYTFTGDHFVLKINQQGIITGFINPVSGINYLAQDQPAPLLQIRKNGTYLQPVSATFPNADSIFMLTYPDGTTAHLSFQHPTSNIQHPTSYFKFTLDSITNPDSLDLVVWGPYPTTIGQTVGETVGVVRDSSYAIGIQVLNLKTLGGFPTNESDIEPSYDIFESNNLIDVSDSVKVFYRGQTARKESFGSVIQAYCRNRNRNRIISNWHHDFFAAPAFDDGGVVGSSIALFGCPVTEVLSTISSVETVEGLPHPILDGEWGKTNRTATAAYLITGFGVDNFEDALELTRKAGLKYLYHPGPFENWGHFDLNKKQFPENWETMRLMVNRAAEEGIRLGVHTLSNFITTNDPYVTPVPDPRLAKVGTATLTKSISSKEKNIPIDDPKFFNQMKNNTLHAAMMGHELIRYSSVSDTLPWMLLDCERGAFGTQTATHPSGAAISKLMDHPYRTFLTNNDLSMEVSNRIAEFFNFTGCRQISFDGLEGNWSTGMGQYGRQRFTLNWYNHLKPELRGQVITDASNPGHFFWHLFTRMNWGEPWYAGFRESQTQYRLLNQLYFKRNYIPAMLGWFRMTPQTSPEDIEWMLARSAAFDAGYALVTSPATVTHNGFGDQIIKNIRLWENARMAGAFPDNLKREMQNIHNEYHLEANGNHHWKLYRYTIWRSEYKKADLQPGQPNLLNIDLDNPNPDQPVQFILTAKGKGSAGPAKIILDGTKETPLPVLLPENYHLKYTGGSYVILYDPNWIEKDRIRVIQEILTLTQGKHKLTFEAKFNGTGEQHIKLEIKTEGVREEL